MCSYTNKVANCKKRMIDFDITKAQWRGLQKIKNTGRCAYTNAEFVHKENHDKSPTLERILEDQPYHISNVLWVTKESNSLKAEYIENGKDPKDLDVTKTAYLRRITRILESPANITKIQEPYKHLFNEVNKEEKENIMKTKSANPELILCQNYLRFGNYVEARLDSDLEISFSEYKRLIGKKKCELTKVSFIDSKEKPYLWVRDKSISSVDKNDVLVIQANIAMALNKFREDSKLDDDSFKSMIEVLGGKL